MTTEFDEKVTDPNQVAIIDLSCRNRPLLIAFGGIAGGLAIPPFEFFKLTKDLNINKIYLRDLSQAWYHSGHPEVSNNIDETVRFLRCMVDKSGADQVITVGNSMGGYASILFGILINADVVHAFSPHTNITSTKYIRNKDQLRYVHDNYSNKYFDLKKIMRLNDNLGDFNLYFDSGETLDKIHATYLESMPNVTLNSFDGGGHALIKKLRDSGELRKIIISSINNASKNSSSVNAKQPRSFAANPVE